MVDKPLSLIVAFSPNMVHFILISCRDWCCARGVVFDFPFAIKNFYPPWVVKKFYLCYFHFYGGDMKLTTRFLTSAINFDFEPYEVKSIHKLLFIGLSYLADNNQKVSVSTSDLMDFCLSTRPTVLSAIKQLESVGLIDVDRSLGDLSIYTVKPTLYSPQARDYSEELVGFLLKLDLTAYRLKSIHKMILICMSGAAKKDYSVSLTIGDLMDFCSATKPTIINGIKHLESHGALSVSPKAGSSNLYYLCLDFFPTESDKLLAALTGFPVSVPDYKPMSIEEGIASEIRKSELSGLKNVVSDLLFIREKDRD